MATTPSKMGYGMTGVCYLDILLMICCLFLQQISSTDEQGMDRKENEKNDEKVIFVSIR